MFCPECRSEYREGFSECASCEVPLVAVLPPEEPHPDVHLVTILETADPGMIAVAESLFLEAQIPYLKKGDQIQDLFGLGRLGVNPLVGPVLFQVPEEHEDAARSLLEGLPAGAPDEAASAPSE